MPALGAIERGDPARRLDAVDLRHPHVHQHDVGAQPLGLGDALGAVARLADDLDAVARVSSAIRSPSRTSWKSSTSRTRTLMPRSPSRARAAAARRPRSRPPAAAPCRTSPP